MTREDFAQFRHAYGGKETPDSPQGFWPQEPLSRREAPLWFRKLQPFPLARVLAALEELSTFDRRHAPSVNQVIEAMHTLAPPEVPVPDWQRDMARAQGMTVRELLQAARPAHADKEIAQCFREISDRNLHLRGQETGFIAACERFAADYPADRAFWLEQIAQKRQEVPAPGSRPGRSLDHDPGAAGKRRAQALPRQVGSFTHLGALLPTGRKPHA